MVLVAPDPTRIEVLTLTCANQSYGLLSEANGATSDNSSLRNYGQIGTMKRRAISRITPAMTPAITPTRIPVVRVLFNR